MIIHTGLYQCKPALKILFFIQLYYSKSKVSQRKR